MDPKDLFSVLFKAKNEEEVDKIIQDNPEWNQKRQKSNND